MKTTTIRKVLTGAVLSGAMIIALGAGSAYAASVSSQFFAGPNRLSDNSAEWLIKDSNNTGGTTIIETGDRLRGIFQIQTVENQGGTTRNFGVGGVNEFSGMFDVVANVGPVVGGFAPISFTPYSGFATELSGVGFAGTAGAMVALWQDAAVEFARTDTTGPGNVGPRRTALEGLVNDGSAWATYGFTGVGETPIAGEGWATFGSAPVDISVFHSLPSGQGGGTFNLGLNLIEDFTGLFFNQTPTIFGGVADVAGTGTLKGIQTEFGTNFDNTPADAFDNVDFFVNVVPEPATLGLMGFGLLGLAGMARRRRKAA